MLIKFETTRRFVTQLCSLQEHYGSKRHAYDSVVITLPWLEFLHGEIYVPKAAQCAAAQADRHQPRATCYTVAQTSS